MNTCSAFLARAAVALLGGCLWLAQPVQVTGQVSSDPATEAPTTIPLAMKVRVYLANIEERGITLSTLGFPAIKAAIRESDTPRLRRFMGAEFKGSLLDTTQVAPQAHGPVSMLRATPQTAGAKVRELDADGMAAHLIALRNQFTGPLQLDWKLKDLLPVVRGEQTGAYNGTGQLRFSGRDQAGQSVELLFDLAFDLTPIPAPDEIATAPGWLRSLRVTAVATARTSQPLLVDATAARGFDLSGYYDNLKQKPGSRVVNTGGVYLADINDDGRTDVLVTDINGANLYLAGTDGVFKDVTRGSGLSPSRPISLAAFGDFDGDGLPDLVADNQIYHNTGNGRFRNVSGRSSLRLADAVSLGVVDYDRDGKLDLYVSRQNASGMTSDSWIDGPGGPGNQLWRNLGDWQFEDVTQQANAAAGKLSCFTTVWLDVNNDRWPDAYAINEFGGGRLLLNRGNGTFESRPLIEDYNDFGSMGLAVADINNDGHVDIFTANMFTKAGRRVMENLPDDAYPPEVMKQLKRFVTGSELYLNNGGLAFKRAGHDLHCYQVGWSYGPSFVDLDNDGFQDLYATSGFMSADKSEPDG